MSSSGLNQRAISWLADSTASEPWQMFRPTWEAVRLANIEVGYLDGVVASDGAREGSLGIGLAKHHSSHLDDVEAFPDHGADWAGVHVLDQTGEEWLQFR